MIIPSKVIEKENLSTNSSYLGFLIRHGNSTTLSRKILHVLHWNLRQVAGLSPPRSLPQSHKCTCDITVLYESRFTYMTKIWICFLLKIWNKDNEQIYWAKSDSRSSQLASTKINIFGRSGVFIYREWSNPAF